MSNVLIFCSYEVGGLPYKIAEILNQHGIKTYYLSLSPPLSGHDTSEFHYGDSAPDWDLSSKFRSNYFSLILNPEKLVSILKKVNNDYSIKNCFATGTLSYSLKKANIDYHYWSYGSDLDRMCNKNGRTIRRGSLLLRFISYLYMVFIACPQFKKTIKNSESVMIAPYQIKSLNNIIEKKPMFFLPHFLEVEDINDLRIRKEKYKEKICKKYGISRFIFSSTRHIWTDRYAQLADNKGNNIILYAFKKYLVDSGDHSTKLILINKGHDVEYSHMLCEKLNIRDYVVWVNEMKRDELMNFYSGSSLCFGQFATPVISGSVVEPLALATPCVSHIGKKNRNIPYYDETPPVINSNDPDQIAKAIQNVLNNHEYAEKLGHQSWDWAKQHCSHEQFIRSFKMEFNI